MKLLVTIDTEEDEWDRYRPTGSPVENVRKVPAVQAVFDAFGVRPTYLITYPMATSDLAVGILGEIAADGRCEIASHCHPWNTPPLVEEGGQDRAYTSMLCNLPPDLQRRKVTALHETVTERFGKAPTTFRSGRWGFSPHVAQALVDLGYRADTSVAPYVDWRGCLGPDYSHMTDRPYRFGPEDIFREVPDGPLLQVPATVGYVPRNRAVGAVLAGVRETSPLQSPLAALLARGHLLGRTWLSPENATTERMIDLARAVTRQGRTPFLNMMFHSSSLMAGNTPFTRSRADEARFLDRIRGFLTWATEAGVASITLAEAEGHL